MHAENRVMLAQFAILGLINELNLDLEVEPDDEYFENGIFSLEYRPLDRYGREKGRRRKIFDIQKWNIYNLENSRICDAVMIDKLLLERNGLNIMPNLFLADAPEYEPKPIYRRIPIDYGAHNSIPMYGIGVLASGKYTTYSEASWVRNEDQSELFDYLRESDPLYQLIPESHEAETREYNRRLKTSLKGAFLVESIRLSDSLIGFHKAPFDFRGFHNMKRELGHIRGLNRDNYLTSDVKWLEEIKDDIGGWAYSCFQIQKTEMVDFQEFFKNRIEKMTTNLRLDDTKFWDNEREELRSQVEYLQKALRCYKILSELNAEACEKLYSKVRDLAKDFGSVIESVINRLIQII